MAAPKIFEKDPEEIISEIKSRYESGLGKTILPAQPEMQGLLSIAYREVLLRALGDYMLSQFLTAYSTAPILDYKARGAGISRLAATYAKTVLRFNLVTGHAGVLIPAGTRASSVDGKIEFATDIEKAAGVGATYIEIDATAMVVGSTGNNYGVGEINNIVDARPFVESVTNLTVSAGGAAQETDEGLRARIIQAPSQYSTAGPTKAYEFIARSAHPLIIDVKAVNGGAGIVNIYPLVEGGIVTPGAIIDAVYAAASAEEKRPLNDDVHVISPTKMDYVLPVNIILKWGVVQSTTVNRAIAALKEFCTAAARKLGNNITLSQLIDAAMNENISDINFGSFEGLSVPPTAFAVCTSIQTPTVTYENPNA